jgi:hypothetical protein
MSIHNGRVAFYSSVNEQQIGGQDDAQDSHGYSVQGYSYNRKLDAP